jgi:hypothetical protein
MNPEEIEKLVLGVALEFFHHKYGDKEYDRLIALQQTNPEEANQTLNQFILDNEQALLKEVEVELVESTIVE